MHNFLVTGIQVVVHNSCSVVKVGLGGNDLSSRTMRARANSHYPNGLRNFATIEYRDLDGNIQYESFRSTASGISGHTEQLAYDFLDDHNIPYENLQRMHSELIPCNDCTEIILQNLNNTKGDLQITFDFYEWEKDDWKIYIRNL